MTKGEDNTEQETPLHDGLTPHDKRLILRLVEQEVRGSRIIFREDGDSIYHVMCGECHHSAPTAGDISHPTRCDAASLWALHDKLSLMWEEEETPPPAPTTNPACG